MSISPASYRYAPPVRAGGGLFDSSAAAPQPPAQPPAQGDSMEGMRMGAPVLRTYLDTHNAYLARAGRANGFMSGGWSGGGGMMRSGYGSYGGGYQSYGMGGGMRGNFGAMGGQMRSLSKLIGGSFVFSAVVSGVSNLIELFQGRKSPQQALGSFCADTAAYTIIGAAATTIGGLIGSFLPIPFLGTALGVLAGAGISWLFGSLYEKNMRPQLSASMTQSIGGMMAHQAPPPPTP